MHERAIIRKSQKCGHSPIVTPLQAQTLSCRVKNAIMVRLMGSPRFERARLNKNANYDLCDRRRHELIDVYDVQHIIMYVTYFAPDIH